MSDEIAQNEEVLQLINTNFISIRKTDRKKVNKILNLVIDNLIDEMRSMSKLFDYLYEGLYYGGSFYCGLKIGRPDEFDINIKFVLSDEIDVYIFNPLHNEGYVYINVYDWQNTCLRNFREFHMLVDNKNFLLQNELIKWMLSLVEKSLNNIKYILSQKHISVSVGLNGPAILLEINFDFNNYAVHVDLASGFEFCEDDWPKHPFRSHRKFTKKDFMAVPKKPSDSDDNRLWRLGFQEQEYDILRANYHGKAVFRLLKKLRDTKMQGIFSYALKTVFIWQIQKNSSSYWQQPMSVVFLDILKIFQKHMENHHIPYYWQPNENLLEYTNEKTTDGISKFLKRMIHTIITENINDPYIFAKYLLTKNEYKRFSINL